MRWLGRDLATVDGLFNDQAVDHFIATKHAWAWAAVRALPPPVRVLETHAGYGWLTTTYAAAGATVTAIERDPAAVACLRANVAGLPVKVIPGDAAACLPDGEFDLIDVDPAGSPQPVLATILARYRPRVLFVTFGDVLYFRFRRGPELAAGLRYGDVWREHHHELDRPARNFGRLIGYDYIRRAWPDAELAALHVWPRTGSTRLAISCGPAIPLPDAAEATLWAMERAR